jgi:hypothetical protein
MSAPGSRLWSQPSRVTGAAQHFIDPIWLDRGAGIAVHVDHARAKHPVSLVELVASDLQIAPDLPGGFLKAHINRRALKPHPHRNPILGNR